MATPRQRKAAIALSENISKKKPESIGKVLRDVGYTDEVSKRPSQVIDSQGFKEVLEELGVTDDKLATVLADGLEANKVISAKIVAKANEQTDDFIEVPDYPTRHKYLETGLRLKGYSKEPAPNIIVVPIYSGRSVE